MHVDRYQLWRQPCNSFKNVPFHTAISYCISIICIPITNVYIWDRYRAFDSEINNNITRPIILHEITIYAHTVCVYRVEIVNNIRVCVAKYNNNNIVTVASSVPTYTEYRFIASFRTNDSHSGKWAVDAIQKSRAPPPSFSCTWTSSQSSTCSIVIYIILP